MGERGLVINTKDHLAVIQMTETEFDEEFRQWILDFPKNEMPAVYELIAKYKQEKTIYIFHTRNDIENYLSLI